MSDPSKQVAKKYGVLHESGQFAQRWTFYIDSSGVIQHIDREVDPRTAGETIVAKSREHFNLE